MDHGSLVMSYTSTANNTSGVQSSDRVNVTESYLPVLHDTGGETLEIVFDDLEETISGTNELVNELVNGIKVEEEDRMFDANDDTFGALSVNDLIGDNCSSELQIVEYTSLAAVEIKAEEGVVANTSSMSSINGTPAQGGIHKPKRNFRKGGSKTPSGCGTNGQCTSDSEQEYDDDDRAYNRKYSRKNSILPAAYEIKTEHVSCAPSRSRSTSKTPTSRSQSRHSSPTPPKFTSRSTSRHPSPTESRSASRQPSPSRHSSQLRKMSSVYQREVSGSPDSAMMRSLHSGSDLESDAGSYNSDCENMDIGNKLIELANPVPYNIEQERKLRFLTGHASRSIVSEILMYLWNNEEFRNFVRLSLEKFIGC